MERLVIASGNAGKVREFKEILQGWEITSMKEEGVAEEVDETGTTFQENAEIKARALAERLKKAGISAIAIADDSGIEIDALTEARAYIQRGIWERIPPMRRRIGSFWKNCRMYRRKKGRPIRVCDCSGVARWSIASDAGFL